MAILRSLFDTASKFNLPDIGISKLLGVKTSSDLRRENAGSGRIYEYSLSGGVVPPKPAQYGPVRTPQVAGAFIQNPAGIRPASGGLPSTNRTNQNTQTTQGPNVYQQEQSRLNQELDRRQSDARNQASGIFNPLIDNYSAQLGNLSGEQSSLQDFINRGSESGRGLIQSQLEGQFNRLGGQEANVRSETGRSLRNLEEDQRNTTTSLSRQLGARGAGDTSAGDYASAAIGRQGLKQRGGALESQATGLREIEGRRVEVQNVANQSFQRLERDKQNQLGSLARDFQNIQRQLESAKATATSDQRRYIADQQNQLKNELSQRLYGIEGEVRQRRAALEDWGVQQETLLSNSLQEMMAKGQYDDSRVLSNLSKFGTITASLGGVANQAGFDALQSQYAPGITGSLVQPKPVKKTDLQDLLDIADNLE